MTRYVGIDVGTLMIKASATASAEEDAAPVSLSLDERCFPMAVRRVPSENGFRLGWPAFLARRRCDIETATAFRDRLVGPESTLMIGGRSYDGLTVQTALFTEVGKSLLAAVPDMTALAVTVPDTWSAPRWSLPMALQRAGWAPLLFVREWCAALASREAPAVGECVTLSLGRGAARAALCVAGEGRWEAVAVAETEEISGQTLHQRLVNRVAEELIRQTRRDPREDPEADQLLTDAVDAALRRLQRGEATSLQLRVFGGEFSRQLTGDDLIALTPSFPEKLKSMVQNLLAGSASRLSVCPVVAWGELAELLPVGAWLSGLTPGRHPARVAPPEVLAGGAARLAALACETDLLSASSPGMAVSPADGSVCRGVFADDVQFVRMLETLDVAHVPSQPRRRAFVVRTDREDGARREILATRFRMGRNPVSEYAFDAEQEMMVSAAHAVILREGADYFLSDLESTNDTYVNDKRLGKSRCALNHGDVIRLGGNGPSLRFELI